MVKYDNIPGFPGYYISKRGGLWSNRNIETEDEQDNYSEW